MKLNEPFKYGFKNDRPPRSEYDEDSEGGGWANKHEQTIIFNSTCRNLKNTLKHFYKKHSKTFLYHKFYNTFLACEDRI